MLGLLFHSAELIDVIKNWETTVLSPSLYLICNGKIQRKKSHLKLKNTIATNCVFYLLCELFFGMEPGRGWG